MSHSPEELPQPSHEQRSTLYEIATKDNPDPRDKDEIAGDMTDVLLTDIYHNAGMVSAEESRRYKLDDVRILMRAALTQGMRIGSTYPEDTASYLNGKYKQEIEKARLSRRPNLPPEDNGTD